MFFKMIIISVFLFTTTLFASSIEVMDAYVRAVPPNLKNSASFMKIRNSTNNVVFLQKAESDIANNVELHEHVMKGEMMKMQQVQSIKIPANSTVELKPGGLHVMLIGLKRGLKQGESIEEIELYFSNGAEIELKNIPIKSVMGGMKHHKGHMKHQ